MTERLAVEGGVPVRPALLPYGRQSISEEDIQAALHYAAEALERERVYPLAV